MPRVPAALLLVLLSLVAMPVEAQSARNGSRSLVEQMRLQRLRARASEVLGTIGPAAPARGIAQLEADSTHDPRRVFWWLPASRAPEIARGPLAPPLPPEPEPEPERPALAEIRWKKVNPLGQAAFLDRFREAIWTNDGMRDRTPLDTIPTPELRARLNYLFGIPTRTAVARDRGESHGGSELVQFEYWFVVNDSIPFVVMDVDGPFGRGLVYAGDLAHEPLLGLLRGDLVRRVAAETRRMPFVDYYHSREREQWYLTGFDGDQFYVEETRRPRWARRSRERDQWYIFR